MSDAGIGLPTGPRAMLEAQFGMRFDDVRLHIGPSAIAAARQLGAAAYALGRDIAFGDGFYTPHTDRGLRLFSHELTHVIQSRNAPKKSAEADELFEGTEPLEQEATAASATVGQARTTVRERLTKRTPLCHPIYISSHGDPGYLALAAKFYADWGYSPIKPGFRSIEDIVKDLASQSSIEHITIVSHAASDHVLMEFINGGADTVIKSDWEVSTADKATSLERHLVDVSTVDKVIEYVQKASPRVLDRIGSLQDPLVRQFIWWVVERVRAPLAGYPAAAGIRIEKLAAEHVELYRAQLLSSKVPSGGGSGAETQAASAQNDLKLAEDAVVGQAKLWPWNTKPPKPDEVSGHEQRLKDSPSKDILRVMQKPEFFQNVANVQKNIGDASWIEIQGCRAGKDKDYLKAIQTFFGDTAKPKVSAPDWYQAFGHFGWDPVKDSNEGAKAQWEKKGVPEAFLYWFPIIAGKKLPKKSTYHDLLEYLRTGHVLPLAYPGATGSAYFLLLQGKEMPAFLAWLSRHQYRLTKEADIQQRLFHSQKFGENVKAITVDWLQENFKGAGQVLLRPSPEYAKHIIEVH